MTFFDRAHNFVASGCQFINNSSGKKESLAEVLVKLKEETSPGVSYDSIDHVSNPSVTLNEELASIITSGGDNDKLLHFIYNVSPSAVREYGESAAKHCKAKPVLLATVFFRRLLAMFPAEGKRRLVTTLAYQLAVSPHAPEELKIEILGALYLEPDLPERNLASQFEKLIVRPLRKARSFLRCPVVFVLDSIHDIDCESVGDVINELAQAMSLLLQEESVDATEGRVDAKVVITGVGYERIIKAFEQNKNIQDITRTYPTPIVNPSSMFSIARTYYFPLLDWKYDRSEFVQRLIEVGTAVIGLTGFMVVAPYFVMAVAMTLLPSPLNIIVGFFGAILLPVAVTLSFTVAITVFAYREVARLVWPRSI